MSSSLLIVESPSKAKTIKKYLGRDFQVLASVGHIKDLPEKEFGIEIEKGFKPRYVTVKGKTKVIQRLRKAAKEAAIVYLATDPDREGEAIAWHIASAIKVDDPEQIKRVLFNEITRSGIQYGIQHPRRIDTNLVNAQQARRVLDRIVGYEVSPFLWRTLYRGLSAGRVQSVALRLICEREVEVEGFVSQEYWELFAELETERQEQFTAKCIKIGGKAAKIANEQEAQSHLAVLKKAAYQVKSFNLKDLKKSPSPPFTTSTLQQEATRRFRFTPQNTMRIAQQLYEGVDIGGETTGLITYMRTDSVRISGEAIQAVREHIQSRYGKEYLPANARHYKKSKKNVQDAHEGIRPTRFELPPDQVKAQLSPDQFKLYSLIWSRFVACQMASAQYRQKTIDVEADSYLLRAIGNDLLFDGYLRAWRENDKENDRKKLPGQLKTGEPLKLLNLRSEQKFTEPPSRYTDGTLIKELDNLEIGRPSTYASIVSTILLRNYVERERGVLKPTELGQTVNRILVAEMDDIFNVRFTAQMEEELDFIESGTKEWVSTIEQFYKPFRKSLDRMQARTKEIKGHLQEDSGEKCNLCGASMLIKWSRNGKFLACSNFPKCKNTRTLNRTQTKHHEVKVCPECGSPMQVKESRFGKFWACTHYPQCKMTLPFSLGIPCPEQDCDGEVVERKTRKGKTFYGCSKYPQCHFATWNEPVQRSCTQCGYPILEKKTTRNRGEIVVCPRCKTEHDTTG